MHRDHLFRRGRQAQRSELATEFLHRRDYLLDRCRALQPDRHRLGMTGQYRGACTSRADPDRQFHDRALAHAPENLARFDHHALFFTRNVRNDVLDDIERGQVAPGARYPLHRGDDGRLDAKALIERLERHCQARRGAVRQRRDIALPSAPALLLVDDRHVIEIDARDHEWHVGLHTIGSRGADGRDMLGVQRLEFARRFGFDRREDDANAVQTHRLGVLHLEREGGARWLAAVNVPAAHAAFRVGDRFLETLARRSPGGRECDDFEIRMAIERGQHLLACDAGGSDHCYWNLHRIKFRPRISPNRWTHPFAISLVRRTALRAYRRDLSASRLSPPPDGFDRAVGATTGA